jgi:hypothetical protein
MTLLGIIITMVNLKLILIGYIAMLTEFFPSNTR